MLKLNSLLPRWCVSGIQQLDVVLLVQASHGDDMKPARFGVGAGLAGRAVGFRTIDDVANHRGVFFT
jgi:hypothetical protein